MKFLRNIFAISALLNCSLAKEAEEPSHFGAEWPIDATLSDDDSDVSDGGWIQWFYDWTNAIIDERFMPVEEDNNQQFTFEHLDVYTNLNSPSPRARICDTHAGIFFHGFSLSLHQGYVLSQHMIHADHLQQSYKNEPTFHLTPVGTEHTLGGWAADDCCVPFSKNTPDYAQRLITKGAKELFKLSGGIAEPGCEDFKSFTVTGFSNGGMMALALICRYPEVADNFIVASGTLAMDPKICLRDFQDAAVRNGLLSEEEASVMGFNEIFKHYPPKTVIVTRNELDSILAIEKDSIFGMRAFDDIFPQIFMPMFDCRFDPASKTAITPNDFYEAPRLRCGSGEDPIRPIHLPALFLCETCDHFKADYTVLYAHSRKLYDYANGLTDDNPLIPNPKVDGVLSMFHAALVRQYHQVLPAFGFNFSTSDEEIVRS